jgi:hypothetical protein
MLTRNDTKFIADGGKVIICEVCLRIAGYNNSDIIDKAITGLCKNVMINIHEVTRFSSSLIKTSR